MIVLYTAILGGSDRLHPAPRTGADRCVCFTDDTALERNANGWEIHRWELIATPRREAWLLRCQSHLLFPDAHTAQTLLVMARQLFPHDRLGDQYYAAVVEAVDKQAASDAALGKLLTDGVARLDAARGIAWVQLSDGARHAVLKTED